MFKFRYLVALILLVVLVAAVGNAADLTFSAGDQNVVVSGVETYTDVSATVTYTIDNATGNVIAKVTGVSTFDAMSASFDGGSTYTTCTFNSPDWECTIANANLASAASISLIATQDN